MVGYCRELGAVVHTEFRDGNVPASLEKKRFLEETLRRLPEAIGRETVRAAGAGYQEELIRYGNDPSVRPAGLQRYGVIRFVCGAPRSEALMAEARRLPEGAWGAAPASEGTVASAAVYAFVSCEQP